MKKIRQLTPIIFFIINTFMITIWILHSHVISEGWDTIFHLNQINELTQSIKAGHILSSNGTFSFSNIGLAVNKFYPYLFLYPFAISNLLVNNPISSFNITISLFVFLSFLVSYYSIRAIKNVEADKTAFWFSILYNNSAYLLLQITIRGDISEYFALLLLPLFFLGAYSFNIEKSKLWLLLPIGFVLIAYSHILSVIIFSSFILLVLCIFFNQIKKYILKRIVISALICIVALIPLILPMLQIKLTTAINLPDTSNLLMDTALKPSQLFINSLDNQVPTPAQAANLGIIILAILIYAFFYLVVSSVNREISIIFVLGIVYIFLSTNLFPWFIFQKTPFRILQFPWRFLGVGTFCLSYVGAIMLVRLKINRLTRIILLCIIMCISFDYVHNFVRGFSSAYQIKNYKEYTKWSTSSKTHDYMPDNLVKNVNGDKTLDIQKHMIKVNGKEKVLKDSQFKVGYNKITYILNDLKPNKVNEVELPLINYGNNTSKQGKIISNSKGNTIILIKPNKSSQLVTIKVSN